MQELASPPRLPTHEARAGMPGFSLARLAGIELRLDWSLALLFVLVAVDLGAGVFPSWHPDWSPRLGWGLALTTAVLLLVSITLHELSHALVARANHIPVRRVTLFVFGGLAEIEGEARSPGSEFVMAAVGPVVSIGIGLAAMSAAKALLTGGRTLDPDAIEPLLRAATPLETLLIWVGTVNVTLGVFNLLPGFPLDGGRVLRSLIWALTRDRARATRWAAGAGRGIAWALMGLGVLNALHGAIGQGLWLVLIGWFLDNAARASLESSLLRNALESVPITQLMRTDFARVPSDLSLEGLVNGYLVRSDQAVFPVERDGRWLGVVSRRAVPSVSPAAWPATTVTSLMVPAAEIPVLRPDATAEEAFARLVNEETDEVPVVLEQRLLGMIHRADVLRWLVLSGRPEVSRLLKPR
jgi:Zn-dependent protease/CBS domain-containing protein